MWKHYHIRVYWKDFSSTGGRLLITLLFILASQFANFLSPITWRKLQSYLKGAGIRPVVPTIIKINTMEIFQKDFFEAYSQNVNDIALTIPFRPKYQSFQNPRKPPYASSKSIATLSPLFPQITTILTSSSIDLYYLFLFFL